MCITLFCTSLLTSLLDYNVEMPNFTFCGGHEHKSTTFFLLWFEAAQIHFLSDILVAVTVTIASYWQQNTLY